ncbi:MAG: ATP-binding protein [Deltaproteobacteria bacterium]|nr:ATP-binding protein [Deltaproteobacteria bacterium]
MSNTSGADGSGAPVAKLLQWSRSGMITGSWGPYENFESLVFSAALQTQLQKLALGFLGAQDFCAKAKLPWRRGAFVFGPGGVGKSAASRAVALLLGWQHITIPAHEVLDTPQLTRALFECARHSPSVVVLDNIDQFLTRIDETDFFDIFDLVSERSDGIFWVVTSRKPELVPKNQLVRPGRFEEAVRLTPPSADVKKKYYENHLEPFMVAALGGQPETLGASKLEHIALLESNPDLSYAHLQEMRLLIAKVIMDGDPEKLVPEFQMFCQEQVIAGDRWGSPSSQSHELEDRVRLSDPRLLMSALHITDAFKKIVEATISNATDAIKGAQSASSNSGSSS